MSSMRNNIIQSNCQYENSEDLGMGLLTQLPAHHTMLHMVVYSVLIRTATYCLSCPLCTKFLC